MASHNRRRSSASDSPATSPLDRAPRFSPPGSKAVSPIRRPLHERSNSQSNQHAGPTIRLVGEQGPDVYSKNPFPSQSSQILPPRKVPGYAFERRGSRVSDTVASFEARSQTLAPKPVQLKKVRHSTSTNTSDADTTLGSSFSPVSSRFSQGSTTLYSPTPDALIKSEKDIDLLQEAPSSPLRSTIRAVTPSTSSSAEAPSEEHALTPRASAASLASTESAESLLTQHNTNHQRDSSNYTLVSPSPRSAHYHRHSRSLGSDQTKRASTHQRRKSEASSLSLAYTDYSTNSERPRSASQPAPSIHEARTATFAAGVRVNFPTIRAPSGSSLWASSQDQLPLISSRMNNTRTQVHQWSSQLSTIASESERGSRSIERFSHTYSARSQSQSQDELPGSGRSVIPRHRQSIGDISSSENGSSHPTESSVAVPRPLFSPITRESKGDGESEELGDTVSPLQSPPLRMKTSFLRRWDSDSRSQTSSRPSSAQSDLSIILASTIPAWARVYYRRGERTSLGPPESTTDASSSYRLSISRSGRSDSPSDPFSIHRPRNRPRMLSATETASMSDAPVEQDVYLEERSSRPRMLELTPRLRRDHRSTAQLSAWKAPSFDENFGTMLFSRQNRQISLFCLGFIFPLAWMLAAVLPLPPSPEMVETQTASQLDLEQRFDDEFGPPVADKSHQKANWWRNLNRIMAAVGTLLIGAIIALAILASRMS